MFDIIAARLKQGYRTGSYPATTPPLPDRYRGLPRISCSQSLSACGDCAKTCPAGAIDATREKTHIDLGKCIFCGVCATACPSGAISFSSEHRMAVRERQDLLVGDTGVVSRARELEKSLRSLFGRSLKLRQVSAGGCNACEADVNVLNTVIFDLSRFGIQFVASPRHADGLLVTGPVTRNMEFALRKTYEATPSPKIVIAVGACAISGGMFAGHDEVTGNGVGGSLPVDLYVPGCPPHPLSVLDGLLRLVGRLK